MNKRFSGFTSHEMALAKGCWSFYQFEKQHLIPTGKRGKPGFVDMDRICH